VRPLAVLSSEDSPAPEPSPNRRQLALVAGIAAIAVVAAVALLAGTLALVAFLKSRPGPDPERDDALWSAPPPALPSYTSTPSRTPTPPPAGRPQDIVRAYYAALAARDADKAVALFAPGYDGNGTDNTSLLNSRTLRHPGYVPPRNVRLGKVDPATSMTRAQPPDTAVLISYEAGGKPYRQELRLIPYDGGTGQPAWRIANPLLPLVVLSEVGTPLVAGTPLPTDRAVVAFPGAYTVTLPDQALVAAKPVTLLAGPTDGPRLMPTLRVGAQQATRQPVRRHVDACANRTEFQPDGCPYEFVPQHIPTERVTRRIVRYPGVRVEVGSSGELSVRTTDPGQVEITAHASPSARTYTTPFSVQGRLKLADGGFVFASY
jgi:hypothetical protein